MSVVIAIKDKENNRIVMGADKQGSQDNLKVGNMSKIFKLDGYENICVGSVGMLNILQAVQYSDNLIDRATYYEGNIDSKYLFNEFYPNIKSMLVDTGRLKAEDYTEPLENQFVVAINDKMWLVDGDGGVMEGDEYIVIGSGEEVAIGSLEATKTDLPKVRIEKAIKACSENTLYVNNKIDILTSEERYDIIE